MRSYLKSALMHPLTKGLDLDDPKTTELRRLVIKTKPFLNRIYREWYQIISSRIPPGKGVVLELGSGAGHFAEFAPKAIQSDVFSCRNLDVVTDARRLAFRSGSLKAIAMTDVFHHIPQPDIFLREAVRCLRPGGRIVMIEPWVCGWSTLIYKHLHHEPFLPDAESWEIPETGALSGANGALPWIMFVRDRKMLENRLPELQIEEIRPMMPLRYLVSGGISMRSLVPDSTYTGWRALEDAISHWGGQPAMFALFCVSRK